MSKPLYPIINLKHGKENLLRQGHPWIFSGAIENIPEGTENGATIWITDEENTVAATGTFSAYSSIAIRILEHKKTVIDKDWIKNKLIEAKNRRLLLNFGPDTDTTGCRMVFGEVDSLPGLIVDQYEDVLVFQISTAGIDKLREVIIESLKEVFKPKSIVERSDIAVRREERLEDQKGVVFGKDPGKVKFLEYGVKFLADVVNGQKTGFFLDQKDLRLVVKNNALNREVLNLFSYSGAFAISALKGGAKSVLNVDSSEDALALSAENKKLHKLTNLKFQNKSADVFQFLSDKMTPIYDMVIMDPPALIKSKNAIEEGKKAYHFLNKASLRLIKDKGIFVTSSCSHFFPEEELANTLRKASLQLGIKLHILEKVYQSKDHPISLYFSEGAYLKSFVCLVERS